VACETDTFLNLFASQPLRLRLLIPSIALVVASTMIPVGLRHPLTSYIEYNFSTADFINNLILYMPLGIVLGGSSLPRVFLVALSLSTCAELQQLGYIDRIPSPFDIASNTCGALTGYLASVFCLRATGRDPRSIRIPRPLAAAAIPIAILGALMLVRHRTTSDFSNWSPSFDLAIGNELTGDRPWVGAISRIAIYPFAMDSSQIKDLARSDSGSDAPNTASVKAPPESPIFELQPPPGCTTRYGRPLLSKREELTFYETLVKRNRLTLLVWMRRGNLKQAGPARIVTYSQDAFNRNFTLGQTNDTLHSVFGHPPPALTVRIQPYTPGHYCPANEFWHGENSCLY
jgi:hypothetical protein